MISYGVNPQNATPTFIQQHLATMEATLPFDGVGITGTSGWNIMDPGTSISYATWMSELAPIQGLTFTRLQHNMLAVYINRPADFFDNWSATIQNFANLAAALRDSGVEGVLFDNEPYQIDPWNYPSDPALEAEYNIPNSCSYSSTYTLAQYQAQAELRGQQIMQTMVAQYPQIQVMFFHGPYDSFSGTPSSIQPNNAFWANELEGPFTVGFAEGSGPSSGVQDGGELNFTTLSQYQYAYQYRKVSFASDATNVPFIPESFRPVWSQTMGVDFEVYNDSGSNNTPLSAAALQSTMTNALESTDRYVWFYSEGIDTLDPTSPYWMGQAYLDALTAARAAVPLDTTTTLTDNGPTPSTFGQSVSFTATVTGGSSIGGQTVFIEDADNANAVVASPTLTNSTVTFDISNLTVGTHHLFAFYNGDSTHTASNSSTTPVTQVVNGGAAPALVSMIVNGGAPQYLDENGVAVNLAGQNSVVEQLLVTFNEPVTLDTGAFSIANEHNGVTVVSGDGPNTAAVNVGTVVLPSGGDGSSWIITFTGPGTFLGQDGTGTPIIKDGLYGLNIDPTKVHANSQTMASAPAEQEFWALYGAVHDNTVSGTIGDGNSEVFIDASDFNEFRYWLSHPAIDSTEPSYASTYFAYDEDLDGFVDAGTSNAFRHKLNISQDWVF
jgi:hypothetical protein